MDDQPVQNGDKSEPSDSSPVKQFETIRLQTGGGGYLLRKVIGDTIKLCDPFILVDHIGPEVYKPGEALGAPDHPHRGIDILTYVISGGVKHEDSRGNQGVLREGCVQWMTCGSGLVHSEMPTDDLVTNGGPAEGFQVWVNLPQQHKMSEPHYQERSPDQIPVLKFHGGQVKVLAGQCENTMSTVVTRTPMTILDITVEQGSSYKLAVKSDYNTVCYCWRGSGSVGDSPHQLKMGDTVLLADDCTNITFCATQQSPLHILVLSGEPIKEPCIMFGPFVMDTINGIRQAIADYQDGVLGEIPGKAERLALNEQHQTRYMSRIASGGNNDDPDGLNRVD